MRLYTIHVCSEFEGNRVKNMVTVVRKLLYDVITLGRHYVKELILTEIHAPIYHLCLV